MSSVHFKSLRQDWKTPKRFYEELDKEFHFDFDPCPPNFTVDGLRSEWGKCSFVNPPYSDVAKWIKKSYEESREGKTVVMLIPARPDTKAWHDYILPFAEIRFVKGRLKFDDQKNPAPFPSAVVIFRPSDLPLNEATLEDA